MYEYRVNNIAKSVDGDTFDFDVDLGFYNILRIRVRLRGVDTYEIYGRNAHELGVPARDFAEAWMIERVVSGDLGVRTFKLTPNTPVADGAFGRWLGDVFDISTGALLSDALIEAGFEKA
jgi:endonuclease YncB( thermonuclease family)